MSTTINMSLLLPDVGTTTGPLYASELNAALTVIDAHTHSPGSGVQITPSGLNINADLPFTSNNATQLRSARFISQSSALATSSDKNCISVVGGELYYNDANGTSVAITNNGTVNSGAGSINNLVSPASANYVVLSTKFTWLSDTTKYATMDMGNIIVRNTGVASSKGVTIAPPSPLAADYSLTLPSALPASTKFMSMDSSGNIAAAWAVDNSTLEVSSNTVQVKANGVSNTQLAVGAAKANLTVTKATSTEIAANAILTANITDGNVTTAKIADGNVTPQKRSAALWSQNSTSSATGLNSTSSIPCTFTGTGRPVVVAWSLYGQNGATSPMIATNRTIRVKKNGVDLAVLNLGNNVDTYNITIGGTYIDTTGNTGSLTYDILTDAGTAGPTTGTVTLCAWEL